MLNDSIHMRRAFAPASGSNLAVGFDILGFSFPSLGDEVRLTRVSRPSIEISSIDAEMLLPVASEKNTATIAMQAMLDDLSLTVGFDVHITKGIPVCSGLGGSAASAIAALVALNGFLQQPLKNERLIEYALIAERFASGTAHADNIVPCLYGGLMLVRSISPLELTRLPLPPLHVVMVHPDIEIPTKKARNLLKKRVKVSDFVSQSANLAGFIAGLFEADFDLIKRSCRDVIVEPQRKVLLPGFDEVKAAAMNASALACSFSGAGPTMFALATSADDAKNIARQMTQVFAAQGLSASAWCNVLSHSPAYLIEEC